jgi:uncharacterized membrane protein
MTAAWNWIKARTVLLALLAAPFVISALVWERMPEQMPVHWNAAGEVDRYGAKWEALLLLPSVSIAVSLLFWAVPVLEPRKENLPNVLRMLKPLHVVFALFMLGMYLIGLQAAQQPGLNILHWMMPMMLAMFALIGNYFGKIRPNYFVGIRTPWTLHSEAVWNRTHRLAGRIWVAGSLAMLPFVFVLRPEVFLWVFIPGLLVMVLVPVGYSFWLHRRQAG